MEPFRHQRHVREVPRVARRPHTHCCGASTRRAAAQPHNELAVWRWVLLGTFTQADLGYHVPRVILTTTPSMTHKARSNHARPDQNPRHRLRWWHKQSPWCAAIYTKQHWFHPLSFQQVQALLTLFSKSFSSFPHGTCLLSVSNPYLAWDEIYHPVYAPIPRNATRRVHAVHGGLQMTNRILTLNDSLFQEAYIYAPVSDASWDYNSKPEATISMLSSSLFIRHY